MSGLEQGIKDFVKGLGVKVVGIAGPDRLDGPPSLDPTYIMKGARSVVVMALPMDVPAIYDFLSQKSPTPHNIDQKRMDPHGEMVRVDTYEEAQEIRRKNPYRPTTGQRIKDNLLSFWQWPSLYGGVQPKSVWQGIVYDRKLKQAARDRIKGYKEPGT